MNKARINTLALVAIFTANSHVFAQSTQDAASPTTSPAQTQGTEKTETVTEEPFTPEAQIKAETNKNLNQELKDEYAESKKQNFSALELAFAKEKALNENSDMLMKQTEDLYTKAAQTLSTSIGNISDPQTEDTYFEYDSNADSKEFVLVQIKNTYIKAERGDICLIATRAQLKATASELTNAPTTTSDTEIRCYKDARTTYFQQMSN